MPCLLDPGSVLSMILHGLVEPGIHLYVSILVNISMFVNVSMFQCLYIFKGL